MKPMAPAQQQGAVTLIMVLVLVLLATLASGYSSRGILLGQASSQSLGRAQEARLAAQAALASAEAQLLQTLEAPPDSPDPLTTSITDPFADSELQQACPSTLPAPRWQCARLPLQARALASASGDWSLTAWLARDVSQSPHLVQVHAQAQRQSARALMQEKLWLPLIGTAAATPSSAALVVNGCVSEAQGSAPQICPLTLTGQACTGQAVGAAVQGLFVEDSDGSGSLSAAERQACMALSAGSLPGGGAIETPTSPVVRTPCNRAAWRSVFGDITAAQLQAWSQAQERSGLTASSRPARSIWWIDSPADWTQSLGSAEAPVLLVFSSLACAVRCPRMAAGTRIVGTVYLDAGCNDQRMRRWQAGQIEGQLVIEAGWPDIDANSRIWARSTAAQAFRLAWPEGQDSRRLLPQPGTVWEGP